MGIIFGSSVKTEIMPLTDVQNKVEASDNTNDYIYLRSRILTCDEPNGNGDYLPSEEVKKSYKTFIGKIVDYNHDTNQILGKIIDATYVEGKNGEHDSVDIICKIDKKVYPEHVARIISGELHQMSMEAYAEKAQCGFCGAEFPFADPCEHIKGSMNKRIKAADGSEVLVYRKDLDLTFVGAGIVESPADKNAQFKNLVAKNEKKYNTIKASELYEYVEGDLKDKFIDDMKLKDFSREDIEVEQLTHEDDDFESGVSGIWLVKYGNKKCKYKVTVFSREEAEENDLDLFQHAWHIRKIKGSEILSQEDEKIDSNTEEVLKNINAYELFRITEAIKKVNDGEIDKIVAGLESLIDTPIFDYELTKYLDKRLTAYEVNKIKDKLIKKGKLIGKDYNAHLISIGDEKYWLITKNGLPNFKQSLSNIWGMDINDETIKIDDMTLKEYAQSDLFKRRLLATLQIEGEDYVKSVWGMNEEEDEKSWEEVVNLKAAASKWEKIWKSYGGDFYKCVEKTKHWSDNPEAYCAWLEHEATGYWPREKHRGKKKTKASLDNFDIKASLEETEKIEAFVKANKEKLESCIIANKDNVNIKPIEGQTQQDAVEVYCFKQLFGIQSHLKSLIDENLINEDVLSGKENFKTYLEYRISGQWPIQSSKQVRIKLFAKEFNKLSDNDKKIFAKGMGKSTLLSKTFDFNIHPLASEIEVEKLLKNGMSQDEIEELYKIRFGG